MQIKRDKMKVSGFLMLLIGFIALVAGLVQGRVWGLLVIPLFLIGLFGTALGSVPYVGPILYFLGIGWIINIIRGLTGDPVPIASDILFYSFLVMSSIYCVIASIQLTDLLFLKRKLNRAKNLMKKVQERLKEESKDGKA
jgi:4-amino-4-deoxy-L-arabinose transferase-like glycosyltransferase